MQCLLTSFFKERISSKEENINNVQNVQWVKGVVITSYN